MFLTLFTIQLNCLAKDITNNNVIINIHQEQYTSAPSHLIAHQEQELPVEPATESSTLKKIVGTAVTITGIAAAITVRIAFNGFEKMIGVAYQ